MRGKPILEVNGLTRVFGGLVAVNDVTLSLDHGEILGVIGPNGAGKTTFFNMIAGAIAPTRGTIAFDGLPCTGLPAHAMARLGMTRTFQITSLFPTLSALDNVRAGAYRVRSTGWWDAVWRTRAWRREEADIEEAAHRALAAVELDHRAEVLADALSYGEQRRLEIAIALAAAPRLLLLDEPAAGMNPEEGQRLVGMIRRIRDSGVSILLVEHHMRVVMTVCDRVVVLDHGVLIAEGPPREVAGNPDVVRVYLGREPVGA